jgi:predicted alpha/beta hydrolase family esterase
MAQPQPHPAQPQTRRYLVLHGLENHRPEGHWQRLLAGELRRGGHQVLYPQLPDADSPSLDAWLEALGAELAIADEMGDGPLIVVAHSLAAVLWLTAASRGGVRADHVLLVAPAGAEELEEHAPEFVVHPADGDVTAAQVAAAGGSTLLVWSGDDEWCRAGADTFYAEPLGLPVAVVPGANHLALGDGYGPWPDVVAWALDPDQGWPVRR